MSEDGGGAADGFVDGGGLHVDGVVYAAAIPERNFAVLDRQGSAFAVEEGQGIVANWVGKSRRNRGRLACVLLIEANMAALWLAALILGSAFAIVGAQEAKWKLLNVVIIAGCMVLGLGIGYAAGLGSKNMGMVPNGAIPFAMIFGVVGAMGCVARNLSRTRV